MRSAQDFLCYTKSTPLLKVNSLLQEAHYLRLLFRILFSKSFEVTLVLLAEIQLLICLPAHTAKQHTTLYRHIQLPQIGNGQNTNTLLFQELRGKGHQIRVQGWNSMLRVLVYILAKRSHGSGEIGAEYVTVGGSSQFNSFFQNFFPNQNYL